MQVVTGLQRKLMFEISVVVDLCSKDPLLAPAGVLVFILVYYIPSKCLKCLKDQTGAILCCSHWY